jgi:4'-phosphopantetheinyl transferase
MCTTVRTDIWFFEVDRPVPEIEKFEAQLSQEEMIRSQRFRFLRDRNRYVIQHGVLRWLLAGYTGCEPCHVDIHISADGKPYLAGGKGGASIHFSISHSDAVAAFAFSRTGSIGIDIENIRDIPEMIEIAERHFTTREKREIFSCPESSRSTVFTRIWTRKEAVLKAQGQGLMILLNSVDVSTQGNTHEPWKVPVRSDGVSKEFWVADIAGPAGFAAAVAAAGPVGDISVQGLNLPGHPWGE